MHFRALINTYTNRNDTTPQVTSEAKRRGNAKTHILPRSTAYLDEANKYGLDCGPQHLQRGRHNDGHEDIAADDRPDGYHEDSRKVRVTIKYVRHSCQQEDRRHHVDHGSRKDEGGQTNIHHDVVCDCGHGVLPE